MAYRAGFQHEQPAVAISGRWLNEHANQMGTILSQLTDINKQQNSTVSRLGDIKGTLDTAAGIVENREDRHKHLTDIIENLTRENIELRERLVVVIADLQSGQSQILQAIDHLGNTLVEDNTATDVQDILTRVTRIENENRKTDVYMKNSFSELIAERYYQQAKITRALILIAGGATLVAMLAVSFIGVAHANTNVYQSSLQTCRLSIRNLMSDILAKNIISIDSSLILSRLTKILLSLQI